MDNYSYADDEPGVRIHRQRNGHSKKDAEYLRAWIDRTLEITTIPDWEFTCGKRAGPEEAATKRALSTRIALAGISAPRAEVSHARTTGQCVALS